MEESSWSSDFVSWKRKTWAPALVSQGRRPLGDTDAQDISTLREEVAPGSWGHSSEHLVFVNCQQELSMDAYHLVDEDNFYYFRDLPT